MKQILKRFFSIFKPKPKVFFVNDRYKVVPAFRLAGEDYFMFENIMDVPSGRQLTALAIYEEIEMRVDKTYLEKHTAAMEKVLSNPKGINLGVVAQLNTNLKERLELLPLQDQILKFASVVFFTKDESLFQYDYEYNRKKIARWKEQAKGNKALLDFFLSTPLVQLVPYLNTVATISDNYLEVQGKIDAIHQRLLTNILSGKASKTGGNN